VLGDVPLLYAHPNAQGDLSGGTGVIAMSTSRRQFLQRTSALIVGFSVAGEAQVFQGLIPGAPAMGELDSWITIGSDGSITAYSGKEELGQGIATVQQQLVAEELSVPFES